MQLTAVFMQVPEGFIAFVEELPGANTQGETLDEARDKFEGGSPNGVRCQSRNR